jgi:hypothetical protein
VAPGVLQSWNQQPSVFCNRKRSFYNLKTPVLCI